MIFFSSRHQLLHFVAFLIEFVYCRECVHFNWTGLAWYNNTMYI